MNRIKLAYLALTGRLKPTVREIPVIGDAAKVTLYRAAWIKREWKTSGGVTIYGPMPCSEYYLSCREAFRERPNAEVTTQEAVRIGEHYFTAGENIEMGCRKWDAEDAA